MYGRKIWAVVSLLGLFGFWSCGTTDVDAEPTITVQALGTIESPGDKIFYTGSSIHVEAVITAPARIQKIELEVQQKSGYGNYTFRQEYIDEYAGKKSVPLFHDHSVLPEDLALGDYLFQLKVTDRNGRAALYEADVTVKAGNGEGGGHVHE